jgi:hypothetical protein
MRLDRVVLTALAVAVSVPAACLAQYTPQWHVGDWWVTKTWERSMSGRRVWHYMRYDIVGVEKVDDRDCFVLETRHQSRPDGALARTKQALYVRRDDWLVVRKVSTRMYNDKLLPPDTLNCPLGLFGPFHGGEPRLPRFPLQPGRSDTAFRLQKRNDCSAYLREISSIADSALVMRLFDAGDSTGPRVMRPTGVVFQARSELGGNLEPGPLPGQKRIVQSLQFWSEDQPWRMYEELVQYDGPKLTRYVEQQAWLIASGHTRR